MDASDILHHAVGCHGPSEFASALAENVADHDGAVQSVRALRRAKKGDVKGAEANRSAAGLPCGALPDDPVPDVAHRRDPRL